MAEPTVLRQFYLLPEGSYISEAKALPTRLRSRSWYIKIGFAYGRRNKIHKKERVEH